MTRYTSKFWLPIAVVLIIAAAVNGRGHPGKPIHVMGTDSSKDTSRMIIERLFGLQLDDAQGGGVACVSCTIAVGLTEQLSVVHDQPVENIMDMICNILPPVMHSTCTALVAQYGQTIIEMLDAKETPDAVCQEIRLCSNPQCRLFPPPSMKSNAGKGTYTAPKEHVVGDDPFQWIIDEVEKVFNSHKPLVDFDGDLFSIAETLRGYSWRGRDCNDFEPTIYPGRKQTDFDPSVDHDCNGIYGTDSKGTPYEEVLCPNTRRGIVLLGDSAGAHFHVPPDYVNSTAINDKTFANLIEILENEFDWPFMSSTTGYANSTWVGHPVGVVDSGYLRSWKQDHCIHRDYQNICVNGARSSSMASTIMYSMARNLTTDHPLSLFYALIGNDVCNPHHDVEHMTTPAQFYKNIMTALNYLETVLPSQSHIAFMGLVDGRILYDTMHSRIHPIGSLRNDVTYATFYDFMNCLHISPCFGWMNTNETWRNITSERAMQLNQAYKKIVATEKFKNFNLTYFDCPMEAVVKQWRANGGHAWELIEPVDGFHPTQLANALLTEYQWQLYEKDFPYLVPQLNPKNAEIEQLFGNQGGYVSDSKPLKQSAAAKTYVNPLVNDNCPDPGAIEQQGLYWVATTSEEALNSFPIRVSADLVNWQMVDYIFPHGNKPSWAVTDFWAPEIHHYGDHFVAYFVARDTTGELCVGAATSDNIAGPFTDIGKPLVRNATMGMIDPTRYFDPITNTSWLFWKEDGNGAHPPEKHTPIWAQQLTSDGIALLGKKLMVLQNDLPWEGPLVEGPWVIKRNNYYYLFYSANTYFNGNYAVGVARAKDYLGPYTKHPTPILHTSEKWVGPGHCSVIEVQDDVWVMIYHAWLQGFVGGNNNRVLMMDTIIWEDDWPTIKNNIPSNSTQPAPPAVAPKQWL